MTWIRRLLLVASVVLATIIADVATVWWTPVRGIGLLSVGVSVLCAYYGFKLVTQRN